ncbi:hypothetical protein FOA52_012548 [Chlamydomonas sp. UWO 241]|nr:hypothetical protein FOA52_012548 [Chlamydomonas sp. UWO 241]
MPPLLVDELRRVVRKFRDASCEDERLEALKDIRKRSSRELGHGTADDVAALVEAGAVPVLVQQLAPGLSVDFHMIASTVLGGLAQCPDATRTIVTAGGIRVLVRLLEPSSDTYLLHAAAMTLILVAAAGDGEHAAAVAASGALSALVQLLASGVEGPEGRTQTVAIVALGDLTCNPKIVHTVAASGAIAALVQLVDPLNSVAITWGVAKACWRIAQDADVAGVDAAAGAIPRLVQLLQPGSEAAVQKAAAQALGILTHTRSDLIAHVAAAGAVRPLMRLLGAVAGDGMLLSSVYAPTPLTWDAGIAHTIAAAGAIPPLVRLLGCRDEQVQMRAADMLGEIGVSAEDSDSIAIAGAIPALVQLLTRGDKAGAHRAATAALGKLSANLNIAHMTVAVGAVALLLQLLGPRSSALMRCNAAGALSDLAKHDVIAARIVAAGAIPPLARLLGPSHPVEPP